MAISPQENFVESPGKQASQESVLGTLNLTEEDKGLAACAVTKTFPSAYNNIRRAVSFESTEDEVTLDAESKIGKTEAVIAECRRSGKELLQDIIARVTAGELDALEALLIAYKRETELLTAHTERLDKLYEREIQLLIRTNSSSTLSQSEKKNTYRGSRGVVQKSKFWLRDW